MYIYEKIGTKKYKATCTICGNIKYICYKPKKQKECNALTCGDRYYEYHYIGKTFGDMKIIGKEDRNFIIECQICNLITKVRISNFINNTFHNQEHSNCHKILYRDHKHEIKKLQNFKERWRMIIRRCCDKNHKSYDFYSQFGVCERWKDFMLFYNDMYKDFKEDLQIDRIDGTKGYSKENCRWVTAEKNAINRRTTKDCIAYNLKTKETFKFDRHQDMSLHGFCERNNLCHTTVVDRLNHRIQNYHLPTKGYVFFNTYEEMNDYLKKHPSVESKCDFKNEIREGSGETPE